MNYIYQYITKPEIDNILMTSDGQALTGLWFDKNDEYLDIKERFTEQPLPVFDDTVRWLNIYFSGENPSFTPSFKITGATPFRNEVIEEMMKIPFGKTVTYNDIAKTIAEKHSIQKMSCQAVGNAVGWNPICIIVPCHRVIGSNGSLTGYGGGLKNKIFLLKNEGVNMDKMFIPAKGNKL